MLKRILYIGGFELPDKNAAAHRVLSIAKAWRENEIEVIFLGISKDLSENNLLNTEKNIQGFTAYSVPYPKRKKEWIGYLFSIEAVKKIINHYGKIDAIVCYNYQAVAFDRLRHFCKKKKIKIYSDCTEWYNTQGASVIFKILKGFDTWYRMKIIQKKLDGLIVISSYLKKYYADCKNVIVIPPLVDIKEPKWNEKSKRLGEGINFIYAGQPGNKDKIDKIVKSYKQFVKNHKADLWVIGINEKQFLENYSEFVKQEIPTSVHFLGRISHEDSLAYLKGADCSLIIRDATRTNNAGFPTKFAEAITLGVGVIATDISDLKEYASQTSNVIIVETSIYDAMERYEIDCKEKNIQNVNALFDYRSWKEAVMCLLE